jgi:hypothetical protein
LTRTRPARGARPREFPFQWRGKASGVDIVKLHTNGATLFEVADSKVTKIHQYLERDHAFADLGLAE